MRTQSYIPYAKRLAEKFLHVCNWVASCYTNGQIENLEAMVLPWFAKTRDLYRALINKCQVQRALIAALPQKARELEGDVQPGESDPNDLDRIAA